MLLRSSISPLLLLLNFLILDLFYNFVQEGSFPTRLVATRNDMVSLPCPSSIKSKRRRERRGEERRGEERRGEERRGEERRGEERRGEERVHFLIDIITDLFIFSAENEDDHGGEQKN